MTTRTAAQRAAVWGSGLAAAVVALGFGGMSLLGQPDQPAQQQPVTVSDEASETPAAEPTPSVEATSASPTATAAPVTTKPAPKSTTSGPKSSGSKTTTSGSKTMTEPDQTTEPQPAPTVPQNNPGDVLPPAPKRCVDERGFEIPCPRD